MLRTPETASATGAEDIPLHERGNPQPDFFLQQPAALREEESQEHGDRRVGLQVRARAQHHHLLRRQHPQHLQERVEPRDNSLAHALGGGQSPGDAPHRQREGEEQDRGETEALSPRPQADGEHKVREKGQSRQASPAAVLRSPSPRSQKADAEHEVGDAAVKL